MAILNFADAALKALQARYGGTGQLNDYLVRYSNDLGFGKRIVSGAALGGLVGQGNNNVNEALISYFSRFADVVALGVAQWVFAGYAAASGTLVGGTAITFKQPFSANTWVSNGTGASLVSDATLGGRLVFSSTGGANSVSSDASYSYSASIGGLTAIAVCKPNDANGSGTLFAIAKGDDITARRFSVTYGNNTATQISVDSRRLDADLLTSRDSGVAYSTAWQVVTGGMNYTGAVSKSRVNGTQIMAEAAHGSAGLTDVTNSPRVSTCNPLLTAGFNGNIASILVFPTYLSDANCLAVERWLGDQYNVAVA